MKKEYHTFRRGGQGILSIATVIGKAALKDGLIYETSGSNMA